MHPAQTFLTRHGRLIAVVAFMGLAFVVWDLLGWRDHINVMFLHDLLASHPVTGLVLFVALFVMGNLVQLPGLIFLGAAVLVMGEWQGGVATLVAAVVSCVVTFGVIRVIGADALRRVEHPWMRAVLARLDARPVMTMAMARVVFQTLPALNVALALSGVRFRHYLMAALIGLPLPIALYCVFFHALARLLGIPVA